MTQDRRNMLLASTSKLTLRLAREEDVMKSKFLPGQNPGGHELIGLYKKVRTLTNIVDELLKEVTTHG